MDPLTTIGIVSASISLLSAAKSILIRKEFKALSETYGGQVAFIVGLAYRNTASEYARLEEVVLEGDDQEALLFRSSVATECNMTAVAGAIIAQVALTALSLPNLSLAHWTARAFLLFATVAGCLSVYYACKLQRTIGKLYRPEMVRDWLTIGSRRYLLFPNTNDDRPYPKARKAALSAVFILSAPYTMMSYSIWGFIIGIAIYQGYTWTHNLDTDAGSINSRNVFITFIVSTGYCQLFFLTAAVIKDIEGWIDFGTILQEQTTTPHQANRGQERLEALQMDEYPAADSVPSAPSSLPTAAGPQQQGTNVDDAVLNLAALLEEAARAHEASAEADRRVASEYRALYTARNF